MGFLIFDTDKQSTKALRSQLGRLGARSVHELSDWTAVSSLGSGRTVMPEMIFLDEDGDPERVDGFRRELESGKNKFAILSFGSSSKSCLRDPHHVYLRKPVFFGRLEKAIVDSYARTQERLSTVGYLGGTPPTELLREIGRTRGLWRELEQIDPVHGSLEALSGLGMLLVEAPKSEREMTLVHRLYRLQPSARAMIVGVGTTPQETFLLRNRSDFFVPRDANWSEALLQLAKHRVCRFQSEVLLARAKAALTNRQPCKATRLLKKLLASDPWNLSACGLLADIDLEKGRVRKASALYSAILALNPCRPRPYLKLIEIEKRRKGTSETEILGRAKSFCPNLKEVQEMS